MLTESFLITVALKSLVVLSAAWLAAAVVRRRSAAARDLIWTAAFAALLALPLLSVSMPELRMPRAQDYLPPSIVFQTASSATPAPSAAASAKTIAGGAPAAASIDWIHVVMWLWAAGSAVAFASMFAAWIVVWRVRRMAPVVDAPELPVLARSMGLRDGVIVLGTERGSMPMTFGLFRPAIFLPADAAAWSEERRRMVLMHELAHIRRCDIATHLLARVALNLYWWNPLAWAAWREFLNQRERATDDLVLAAGARASEYAGHLLDIARSMQTPRAAASAALAMARPSQLEKRLAAILDAGINRSRPGRAGAAMVAAVAIMILAPLAALQAQEERRKSPAEEFLGAQLAQIQIQVQAGLPEKAALAFQVESKLGIAELRALLAELRKTYNDGHPDVLRVKAELAQRELRALAGGANEQSVEYGIALQKAGDLARQRRDAETAGTLYARALTVLGNRVEAVGTLTGLGVLRLGGDLEQAFSYFQRAQQLDPAKAGVALMWMAMVRQRQNNVAEAESLFNAALAVQEGAPAATTMELYSQLLFSQKRNDEAMAMRERAAVVRKSLAAVAPPQPSAGVFRTGGDVKAPSLARKVEPQYTDEARFAKHQGTAVLYTEIGPDGRPRNTRVLRGLGLGLDETAMEAVSQWLFNPGTRDGQPVTVAATIEVNFRLL